MCPDRTLAVASAQNAAAKDLFIEISRSIYVSDGDKKCDRKPVPGGHLIALLFDLQCSMMTQIPINRAHPLIVVVSYSYLLPISCLRAKVPKI